jgi:hypothetical protein
MNHTPSISVTYIHHASAPNVLGMRPMQERAYQKRGEQRIRCELDPFYCLALRHTQH